MRVILLGSSGQLGRSMIFTKPKKIDLICPSKSELNLLDINECKNFISKNKPHWIINCAAYTNVDESEIERDQALKINKTIPENLANSILQFGGKLLHISTDFVFNGDQNYPYTSYQKRSPINYYGFSKSEGEVAIEKILGKKNQALIFRTSWLMSPFGKNFLMTVLKLIQEKDKISVVYDQIGCPTNSIDLAKACWNSLENSKIFEDEFCNNNPIPIIHWSNLGVASWFDVAISIKDLAHEIGLTNKSFFVLPIKSNQFKCRAIRPKYSLLDCEASYKVLGIRPAHWRDSIKEILLMIKKRNKSS